MSASQGQSSYDYVVEQIKNAVERIPSKPLFGHKTFPEFERDIGTKKNYVLLVPMSTNGTSPVNGIRVTNFTGQIYCLQLDKTDSTYEQSLEKINEAYLTWEGILYNLSEQNELITFSTFNTQNVYKVTKEALTGVEITFTLLVQDVANYSDLCDPC
jgi:hypothetical protein